MNDSEEKFIGKYKQLKTMLETSPRPLKVTGRGPLAISNLRAIRGYNRIKLVWDISNDERIAKADINWKDRTIMIEQTSEYIIIKYNKKYENI